MTAAPPSAVASLVAHVTQASARPLSAAAVSAVKTFTLDSLAVALAGTRVPLAPVLRSVTREWGVGDAARAWGTAERVPVGTAAFLNGWLIHNQEFDCVHERAVVHPMAVVLATLLAHADARGAVSGKRLMQALSVAVDVAVTIGCASQGRVRFFRPAVCGAFGAVAGLAALDRLDAHTLTHALGLLYSQLSGTMQAHVEGSPVLPMQIGFNARAALTALSLARAGIPGPVDFLEGRFGYFRLMEEPADFTPFATIGDLERITELSHKPFPSGRATHGGVDGLLTLQRQHGFVAADLRAMRVFAPPLVRQLVDRPATVGMVASYARLCLPYVAATALLTGDVGVQDFDADALADPARLALAARISVLPDSNVEVNALAPQRIEVDLVDGRTLALDLAAVLGHPARALTRAQQLAKVEACCRASAGGFARSRVAALLDAIGALDGMPDVRVLLDLLVTP
jgi:2-methylcitrate dehydratase PrpD